VKKFEKSQEEKNLRKIKKKIRNTFSKNQKKKITKKKITKKSEKNLKKNL